MGTGTSLVDVADVAGASKTCKRGLPNCGLAVTVTENRERAKSSVMVAVTNVERKRTIMMFNESVIECGD